MYRYIRPPANYLEIDRLSTALGRFNGIVRATYTRSTRPDSTRRRRFETVRYRSLVDVRLRSGQHRVETRRYREGESAGPDQSYQDVGLFATAIEEQRGVKDHEASYSGPEDDEHRGLGRTGGPDSHFTVPRTAVYFKRAARETESSDIGGDEENESVGLVR